MGMGQGIRAGLGHGGITSVLQTQFASFFGVGVGREQGYMAIYLREHWKITLF